MKNICTKTEYLVLQDMFPTTFATLSFNKHLLASRKCDSVDPYRQNKHNIQYKAYLSQATARSDAVFNYNLLISKSIMRK